MRAGDLVRVTRSSLGRPKGSLALVETKLKDLGGHHSGPSGAIWQIHMFQTGIKTRCLGRDLEVINESR